MLLFLFDLNFFLDFFKFWPGVRSRIRFDPDIPDKREIFIVCLHFKYYSIEEKYLNQITNWKSKQKNIFNQD